MGDPAAIWGPGGSAGARTGQGTGVGPYTEQHPVGRAEADLPPLDELVAGINTVGFAPGAADEAQAERAGRQAVAYATALRERRSWWRRIWWSVHPGPLRWSRGK